MTILPNQSGEIRLTANLLDTRRRSAPPTKGAGSGRLGGHREKDGGRRNEYGESFGYAATLRAANENGGERKGLRGWGRDGGRRNGYGSSGGGSCRSGGVVVY